MRKAATALVGIVLILLALGVVMVASTSTVKGSSSFDDPHHYVKRQVLWLVLALIAGAVVSRIDYHNWSRLGIAVCILSVILLVLVFVPGIGRRVGASSRWIRVGPMTFQPSELAKFAMIVMLSSWMAYVGRRNVRLLEGIILPFLGLGIFFILIIIEPDFGTALLLGTVGMAIMFAGGSRLGHLVIAGVSGCCLFVLAVLYNSHRMGRILAFCMPERFPDLSYQLTQSKISFVMGGWSGVGLGNSMQKRHYLPEAQTDFIFSIIGEEMGIVGTAAILLLFMAILVLGITISMKAPDILGRLLGFGFTMMIVLQAAINIGVVIGCLPTKGLPLPFISYGGSSLLMSVVSVGVLVNIARHASEGHRDVHTRSIRDQAHRL